MAESGSNRNPAKARSSASHSRSKPPNTSRKRQILIVEDNPADIFLIRKALERAGIDAELHIIQDGEEAMQYIDQIEHDSSALCPDLVLLDINLPRKKGSEILEDLRSREKCGQTPVLVISSSNSPSDREEMAKFGANGYFRKPFDFNEFMELGPLIQDFLTQA